MTQKKPTGILLRVSTNMQAKQVGNEADLPTQRTACMRFIAQHPEWELAKEYMEVGVSGFKNTMQNRDKLLEIQDDIAAGQIEVLVVFMFDRLGRIEEETPFVVKRFVEMGCEVWSVQEGQRKFEDHVDSLLNYITFWQASGESKKTSQRVTNTMNQMAESGQYTGGRPPYGYKAVETGGLTKKKLPEKKLAVNEDEAPVVRLIYKLALQKGYGCHRIAAFLNNRQITTRNGNQWGHSVVSNILANPVYKGYRCYNRTTTKGTGSQKRMPSEHWIVAPFSSDLAIVPEQDWNLLQAKRSNRVESQRRQKEHNDRQAGHETVKSRLLFAGITYCGACGAKMYTGYSPYRWTTKDGVLHRRHNPVYRCGGKSTGKTGCTGQLSYKPGVFEPAILQAVGQYLSALPRMDLQSKIRKLTKERAEAEEKALRDLDRKIGRLQKEREALEQRYLKLIVVGQSPQEEAMLLGLLEENREELDRALPHRQSTLESVRDSIARIERAVGAQQFAPAWPETFQNTDLDTKKAVCNLLIRRISVQKHRIAIEFNLTLHEFSHPGSQARPLLPYPTTSGH